MPDSGGDLGTSPRAEVKRSKLCIFCSSEYQYRLIVLPVSSNDRLDALFDEWATLE